jgi:hypothetical protein
MVQYWAWWAQRARYYWILDAERAIAVELAFVRPSRSFGQLRDRQGENRLDEPDLLVLSTIHEPFSVCGLSGRNSALGPSLE